MTQEILHIFCLVPFSLLAPCLGLLPQFLDFLSFSTHLLRFQSASLPSLMCSYAWDTWNSTLVNPFSAFSFSRAKKRIRTWLQECAKGSSRDHITHVLLHAGVPEDFLVDELMALLVSLTKKKWRKGEAALRLSCTRLTGNSCGGRSLDPKYWPLP